MTSFGEFVDELIDANAHALDRAAQAILASLRDEGLLRTAGAGHSLASVMESFYRAGGLAQVRPLWHPSLLPLTDAARSTRGERTEGLGLETVTRAGVEARDTVVVFSSSGINHFPVEVARAAVSAGAAVIAVTSIAASRAAEPRAGARLFELADIVLDTHAPAGDVSRPADRPVTAPVSSLATNALWAALLERIVLLEPDTPLWRSANVTGNDDANAALIARLRGRIPELGSA